MKKLLLHDCKLNLIAAAMLLSAYLSPALAATRTAIANGNWQNTSTWSGGVVPVSGDDVIIPAGITVFYNSNTFNTSHPYVEIGGKLELGPNQEFFQFSTSVSFKVLNGGELKNASTDAPNQNYFWGTTLLIVRNGSTLKVFIEPGGKYTIVDYDQIVLNDVWGVGSWGLLPVGSTRTRTASFVLEGFDESTDPDGVGVRIFTSGITAPVPGGALPVKLQNLGALAVNGTTRLIWQTALEQNSRAFVVEHSVDGYSWTTVGTVRAAGNSNTILKYSFVHANPATGQNSYRLKMLDLDGSVEWSPVTSVTIGQSGNFRVYPLPANDHVIVEMNALNIPLPYTIANAQGKIMKTGTITANKQSITTQELASGVYILYVGQLKPIQFLKK